MCTRNRIQPPVDESRIPIRYGYSLNRAENSLWAQWRMLEPLMTNRLRVGDECNEDSARELIAAHLFFTEAHRATILVSPVGQSVAPVAFLVP